MINAAFKQFGEASDPVANSEHATQIAVLQEKHAAEIAALKKKQSSWMGLIQSEGVHANQGCLARFMTRGMRKREEKIENLQLRGLHLMSEGKWAAAAKHFKEALDLDPERMCIKKQTKFIPTRFISKP